MKWLTTYNDWATKVGNRFSDWLLDHCLRFDAVIRTHIPAIGMTCLVVFIAFVVFLGFVKAFNITPGTFTI